VGRSNTRPDMGTDLQELGAELHIYGEIDDPSMRHFNPSMAFNDQGHLKIAIRSCNFKVERGGKWSFRDGSAYSKTDVLYGNVDLEALEPYDLVKLRLSENTPTRIKVSGLEDVRLFHRKDGMHAIGFESDRLTRSLHNESASLAEFLIKGDELVYLRTLEKPTKGIVEKNWCPPDVPTKEFDFTYSDSQVWKDGKLTGETTTTQIHGGTQLLRQNDGTYLSLVHEKKLEPTTRYGRVSNLYDKFVYFHYLARHSNDGIITELSKPFRFGTLENIEFAAGMVEYSDDFLISLGIRDCKWAVCRIKKDKLIGLFESK
jgi:hypothetical protein